MQDFVKSLMIKTLFQILVEILHEMETKVPEIKDAEAITALADVLKAKKENEELRRARFNELKLTLSQYLENYAEHAPAIMETVQELQKQALPEHQNTLDELMRKHDGQRAKYVRAQDATYRKLCAEAGDAFIAMKALLAEYKIDKALNCQKTIREKLKMAEQVPDVSFDVKNGLASLLAEYAKAGEMVSQGKIDSDLNNRLKPLEDWQYSMQELVTKQELELVKKKLYEYDKIVMFKSLKDDIEKGSPALKNRYAELQEKINSITNLIFYFDLDNKLSILEKWYASLKESVGRRRLMVEKLHEHDEIEKILKNMKTDIGKGTPSMKERYENLQKNIDKTIKEIAELMNEGYRE